ncbi:4-hydroxybutyrate coenzyme A transferase [Thelohanellus kitauei]|uniref:4-hydroxybutyrate coenzyme A transferase n=1 Tax=Thelohanellus kitauei TaxID=669202 RepID=A0A0C2MKZ9_THEKT|nr:4-hydroxybutyrate coenzyme A transferase [Thelohanellus kitauei]
MNNILRQTRNLCFKGKFSKTQEFLNPIPNRTPLYRHYPHGIQPNKEPKICDPLSALSHLKSGINSTSTIGDSVFVQGAAATPTILLNALKDTILSRNLRDLKAYHIHLEGETILTSKEMEGTRYHNSGRLRSNSLFTGPNCRKAIADGTADFVPVFLSQIPALFRRQYINLDFALIHVSQPDEHGYVSLGTSVDVALSAVETANVVIALVNKKMPRTFGDGTIHISNIDYVIFIDQDLHLAHDSVPSEEETQIGKYIADNLIEDGSTLQMGIGNVPTAVMTQIKEQRHIGLHSEMISDPVVDLIDVGIVDNSEKSIYRGLTVSSFCVGTKKLFNFIHNNPEIVMLDVSFTNDPFIVAQNPKVVSINSCLEIDLTGQVVSDSIGTRIYSGAGGQVDFVTGAILSRDGLGKSIITLQSQTSKGESKIVPFLKQGAGVITTRSHVHYIVTEYGIADLRGKNLLQRAHALIQIAHPNHRLALEKAAFERFNALPYV